MPQPLTFISKSSKIENIKSFAFKPNYSFKIFTHFLKDGANIEGRNIKFKLNLKQKNQMFDIPKFKLNSNLIKQKLKENSIKP
jgi:hypothetical protein